jgi:hypothetical protein
VGAFFDQPENADPASQ